MSSDRTAEQKAADAALDQAIKDCARAYSRVPDGFVVTDWIVLGAGVGFREDGDATLGFRLLPDGDRLNWHMVFGLLRAQQLALEHDYVFSGDNA